MTKTRFLILGGSGLIGSRFTDLVAKEKHIIPKEEELDIADSKTVNAFFEKHKNDFDVCINFAAYTNVDEAEKEQGDKNGLAWKLNVDAVRDIAKECKNYKKFLIYLSTDYVFPGTSDYPGPYKEDARLPEKQGKIGWYGWTKLMGEKEVAKSGCEHAIVRTAYPFRAAPYELKKDFVKIYLSLFDEGKLFPLFADQQMTTVFIDDLVLTLEKIAELRKTGIYHVVASGMTSPFEFGSYLIEKARGKKNAVKKGSMVEYLKKTEGKPWPLLGGLDTKKTQKILGMKFRTWKEAVDEFVKQLS